MDVEHDQIVPAREDLKKAGWVLQEDWKSEDHSWVTIVYRLDAENQS